jgi:hypothetical protein
MLSMWPSPSAQPASSGIPPSSPPLPGREAASARESDFSLLLPVEATYDRLYKSGPREGGLSLDLDAVFLSPSALLRKFQKRSLRLPSPFTPEQEQLTDRVIQRQQSLAVLYRTKSQFCAKIKRRATRFYTSVISQNPHLLGQPFHLYAGFGGKSDKGSCARPPRVQNTASVAAAAAPPPPPLMDYHPRRRRHNRPIQQPHHWKCWPNRSVRRHCVSPAHAARIVHRPLSLSLALPLSLARARSPPAFTPAPPPPPQNPYEEQLHPAGLQRARRRWRDHPQGHRAAHARGRPRRHA